MRGRRDRPREGQEFRRNHRILFVKCVAVKEEGKENRVFFFYTADEHCAIGRQRL